MSYVGVWGKHRGDGWSSESEGEKAGRWEMGEAPRLCRFLKSTIRNLAFSLSEIGSHWKAVSKVMTRLDFCFNTVTLASVLRIDCREVRTEAGNPGKWLL